MHAVADRVPASLGRAQQARAEAGDDEAEHEHAEGAAEEEDLEGVVRARELADADGHRAEGEDSAAHPECGTQGSAGSRLSRARPGHDPPGRPSTGRIIRQGLPAVTTPA